MTGGVLGGCGLTGGNAARGTLIATVAVIGGLDTAAGAERDGCDSSDGRSIPALTGGGLRIPAFD